MTGADYIALRALAHRLKTEVTVGSGVVTPLRLEAASVIETLDREMRQAVERGREAALQVLASDGQAQEALDRALAAEAALEKALGFMAAAHRSLLSQCFSNPVVNPWAKEVNMEAVNDLDLFVKEHRKT